MKDEIKHLVGWELYSRFHIFSFPEGSFEWNLDCELILFFEDAVCKYSAHFKYLFDILSFLDFFKQKTIDTINNREMVDFDVSDKIRKINGKVDKSNTTSLVVIFRSLNFFRQFFKNFFYILVNWRQQIE